MVTFFCQRIHFREEINLESLLIGFRQISSYLPEQVPADKFLFAGIVPANKFLFAGTVPANNLFLICIDWPAQYNPMIRFLPIFSLDILALDKNWTKSLI